MLSSDSPKVSPSQFAFVNIKKADGRRWSVASLPRYCENGGEYENVQAQCSNPEFLTTWICSSSGYGTTPGSSNVSSQCSSQVCKFLLILQCLNCLTHLLSGEASSACSSSSSQWTANHAQVIKNLFLKFLQLIESQSDIHRFLTCIKYAGLLKYSCPSGTSLQTTATPPWLIWMRDEGRPLLDLVPAASGISPCLSQMVLRLHNGRSQQSLFHTLLKLFHCHLKAFALLLRYHLCTFPQYTTPPQSLCYNILS